VTRARSGSPGDATPLVSEVFPSLALAFDMAGLLRCLGYPARALPASHLARDIDRLAAQALPCLEPRGAYTLHAVARRTSWSLTLGDTTVFGNVGEHPPGVSSENIRAFIASVEAAGGGGDGQGSPGARGVSPAPRLRATARASSPSRRRAHLSDEVVEVGPYMSGCARSGGPARGRAILPSRWSSTPSGASA
jgi:hypothetical protein